MLHKTHVRRAWYAACLSVFAAAWFAVLTTWSAFAVGIVIQGQVTKQDSSAVVGVRIELHTPDGNFAVNTMTDAGGNYTFSDTLTNGTNYVVEVTAPTGYNRNEPHSQNFTFTTGDTARVYNFGLTQASKTISGQVTDTSGKAITDADISIDPYNVTGASRATARTDATGHYSTSVVGGTWFAQAGVNLSEYTPQWIAEEAPVRLDFLADATTESQTVNFVVTPATGKVTATLLNSDASKLTSSNFVADIDFRRADGVGTTRKVQQSDSSLSVYLTPGIYNICAFHPDLSGKSFDPAATTFVMTDGGNVNLGTIQASVNAAHLTGKVLDASGKGLGNVQLIAIREGGCDRPSTNTQPDGSFDMTVGAGTWTIGLNSADVTHSQVAPVVATVTNGQTVTGLNFSLKTLDKTVTGSVLNSAGTVLTNYIGSAFVQSSSQGTKVYAPIINGAFSIKYSSADLPGAKIFVGAESTEGSPFAGGAKVTTSITGPTATQNVTVLAYDATLSGTILLPDGTAASNTGSDITVEAVDEDGNYVSSDVTGAGAYSLALANGVWNFDYTVANP